MAGMPIVDNALGWVQMRLRGGPIRIAGKAGAYAAIIGACILVSIRVDPKQTTWLLSVWTKGLLVLQAGILILLGCAAIRNVIRRDVSTRMLESHRVAPVSGAVAVVGYLLGATSEATALGLVYLVLGVLTSVGAGQLVGDWLLANAFLVWFAVFLWTATAFFAFVSKAGFGVLVIVAILSAMSGGIAFVLLPGLVLMVNPLVNYAVSNIIGGSIQWGGAYPIALLAQFLGGALFFIGATRKYRRDDLVAFGPWLGSALVAGWVTISIVGILNWTQLSLPFSGTVDVTVTQQLCASTLMSMLFALVPVSAAALAESRWHRRRLLNDPYLERRPISSAFVAFVCAGVCLLLPLRIMPGGPAMLEGAVRIAVMLIAFLLSVSCLLRICYRASSKAAFIVGLWICVTWLGPLFAEVVRFGASDLKEPPCDIAAYSPIVTLLAVLDDWAVNTTFPLAVQVALAGAMAAVYYRPRRKKGTGVFSG